MDHVASGWNGWKSINIFVPDGETYGVNVVSGALDFFRPILAGVVSRGTYTRFGRTFEDKSGCWTRMDSGFFGLGFLLMYLYPFFVSNAAMVFGSKVLIQEVEKIPQKKYKKVQQLQMCQKML